MGSGAAVVASCPGSGAGRSAASHALPHRGQVVHDGTARVVLARDDRVLTVREGEMLDDNYRVESIRLTGFTLVYLPSACASNLP